MLHVTPLNALSFSRFAAQLADVGVAFGVGPFVVSLTSSITSVAEGVYQLYGEYPLIAAETDRFVDYYLSLEHGKGVRRWYRPQVNFSYDGLHPFKPLPLNQALPLFEWGLNWCVASQMHSYLLIHAAVIERNGVAIILPAPPGSGKSTLCAGLVSRGWRLFSDELAIISTTDGQVVPCPRPIGLKNESIQIMRDYEPQAVISRASLDTRKGTVALMKAPSDSIRRATETARVGGIIFPRYQTNAEALMTTRSKAQTGLYLADNSFNYSVTGARGFNTLAEVVDGAACLEFTYSRLDDAVRIFDALEWSA